MHTYARLPVAFHRGEGAWLYGTPDGKTGETRYLDALGGIAVCALGHAHPKVTAAICEQAGKLIHTSNLYAIGNQARLADRLTAVSGMETVFFSNSGAEANEAAIKIARKFGRQKGIEAPTIIVMEGSFHGRTLATLSATGNRKVQSGFEPLVQGFLRVPYGDLEAVRRVAERADSVTAILVEPITGEGGIVIPPEGYLRGLREVCDAHDWLLMLDEIQTGMGRTGRWFACRHEEVLPDVMTSAKALGNGMPIGACMARGRAAEVLRPGNHGSTFGGNPLATAAALAVVDAIESEGLVQRAEALGADLLSRFRAELEEIPGVREIRGKGLMLGIELDRPCGELVRRALDRGLLINVTAGQVIRLLPPYIFDDEQASLLVETLSELIRDFLSE